MANPDHFGQYVAGLTKMRESLSPTRGHDFEPDRVLDNDEKGQYDQSVESEDEPLSPFITNPHEFSGTDLINRTNARGGDAGDLLSSMNKYHEDHQLEDHNRIVDKKAAFLLTRRGMNQRGGNSRKVSLVIRPGSVSEMIEKLDRSDKHENNDMYQGSETGIERNKAFPYGAETPRKNAQTIQLYSPEASVDNDHKSLTSEINSWTSPPGSRSLVSPSRSEMHENSENMYEVDRISKTRKAISTRPSFSRRSSIESRGQSYDWEDHNSDRQIIEDGSTRSNERAQRRESIEYTERSSNGSRNSERRSSNESKPKGFSYKLASSSSLPIKKSVSSLSINKMLSQNISPNRSSTSLKSARVHDLNTKERNRSNDLIKERNRSNDLIKERNRSNDLIQVKQISPFNPEGELMSENGDKKDDLASIHDLTAANDSHDNKDVIEVPSDSFDNSQNVNSYPDNYENADKSFDRSLDKSFDKSLNKSFDKSLDKSFDKSPDQSLDKSLDQSFVNSVDSNHTQRSIENSGNVSHVNDDFHNSTMDVSKIDDTRAQLDVDITFSSIEKSLNKVAPSPQKGNKALDVKSARKTKSSSSWGKFRPSSSYFEETPNLQSIMPASGARLQLIAHKHQKPIFQATDLTTLSKIDDMNKQITGYRIQIKFFKQFLQNLIDKSRRETGSAFDLSELTNFEKSFDGMTPKNAEYNKLEQDYNNLLQNYDEVFKLNEDLYTNLENFESQLHSAEEQLHQLNEYMDSCCDIIDDILNTLVKNPHTDGPTREALIRCLENNKLGSRSLELKLQVVSFEFNKLISTTLPRLEKQQLHAIPLVAKQPYSIPTPPVSSYDASNSNTEQQARLHELASSLEQLEHEFMLQKEETARIEEMLQEEVKQSNMVKERYQHISQKFKELCTTLESTQSSHDGEIEALRVENERLTNINAAVNAKFDEYHEVIDRLQQEVNDFKQFSKGRNSIISELSRNELQKSLLRNTGLESLDQVNKQLVETTHKYESLKAETAATISSLTAQVYSQTQQIRDLRLEKRALVRSSTYDPVTGHDSSILQHKVAGLIEERSTLQATIGELTAKVAALSTESESRPSSPMQHQFKELLHVDVREFQRLLKSFNKIADDASVRDPTRKIDNLSKRLFKLGEHDADMHDIGLIKDLHKSVFNYFARAVEMIVNDHVKLLLKESESSNQTNDYVEKLHARVDELNAVNDSLMKQLENLESENKEENVKQKEDTTSPRTKLRMTELWNRWKSEREARVYESKQADRRLKELEQENSRLRAQLAKGSG